MGMYSWLALCIVLYWCTFGFVTGCTGLLSLIVSFACFLLSVSVIFQAMRSSILSAAPTEQVVIHYNDDVSREAENRKPNNLVKDPRITGSSLIDKELALFMNQLFQQFVDPWYDQLTDNQNASVELYAMLKNIIIKVAAICKEDVDWTDMFLTDIMDAIVNHHRIFKYYCSHQMNNDQLIEAFFEVNCEEAHAFHDLKQICIDREAERRYINELSELLVASFASESDFANLAVRKLLKDIVANYMLLPFVDTIGDADFLDQQLLYFTDPSSLTPNSLRDGIKYSTDSREMQALHTILGHYMKICSLKDTKGASSDIHQFLQSLRPLVICVRNKNKELVGETKSSVPSETSDLEKSDDAECDTDLTFSEIISNDEFFNQYRKFLSTRSLMHYIDFYRCVLKWLEYGEDEVPQAYLEAKRIYQLFFEATSRLRINMDSNKIDQLNTMLNGDFVHTDQSLCVVFNDAIGVTVAKLSEEELIKEFGLWRQDNILKPGSLNTSSTHNEQPQMSFDLTPAVTGFEVRHDQKTAYAVYLVQVLSPSARETSGVWMISRRFSDFDDLQKQIQTSISGHSQPKYEQFRIAAKLPSKQVRNSTDQQTMRQRQLKLDSYLTDVVKAIKSFSSSDTAATNGSVSNGELQETDNVWMQIVKHVTNFLSPGEYQREHSTLSLRVNTLTNPFRKVSTVAVSGIRSIGDSVQRLGNGPSREHSNVSIAGSDASANSPQHQKRFVPVALTKGGDLDPLRLLETIVDEFLDLKQRQSGLRKAILAAARSLASHTYGDALADKLLLQIANITSEGYVATMIRKLNEHFWPDGRPAVEQPPRDPTSHYLASMLSRMKLYGSIPNEFISLNGAEQTSKSINRFLFCMRHPVLARRLSHVLLKIVLSRFLDPRLSEQFFYYSDKPVDEAQRIEQKTASGSKCLQPMVLDPARIVSNSRSRHFAGDDELPALTIDFLIRHYTKSLSVEAEIKESLSG